MSGRVFVGIAVGKPDGMQVIPGVYNGIAAMAAWARSQRYRVELVTDQGAAERVSAERLRKTLTSLLSPDLDRIVVCFIGHGFLDSPDQIWILSDGKDVNTGRISRDALRATTETYGPAQIAMISDACSESRHFASGVVSVLDDKPGKHRKVFVDNLYSTSENDPAFAFPARNGDFSLFTSVLVEFLEGSHPDAFRLANGASPDVTSQTLNYNLEQAVAMRAEMLGVKQEPRVFVGFPVGLDVYSSFSEPGLVGAPEPPPWSRRDHLSSRPPFPSPTLESRVADDSDVLLPTRSYVELAQKSAQRAKQALAIVLVSTDPTFEMLDLDTLGYEFAFLERSYDADSRTVSVSIALRGDRAFPPLFPLRWRYRSDPFLAAVPLFDGLVALLRVQDEHGSRTPSGSTQLSWFPPDALWDVERKTRDAIRVVRALARGDLASRDAGQVANMDSDFFRSARQAADMDPGIFRVGKHANPMLGIVSAYLYDLIGDRDSISRICHYYHAVRQAIPFDVALLSGGRLARADTGWTIHYDSAPRDEERASVSTPSYLWEATPEGVGAVAGAVPALRIGWNRLGSRSDEVLRALAMLSPGLTRAPFATLTGDSTERALELLQEFTLVSLPARAH